VRKSERPAAPESTYAGPDDAILVLRGAMTPKTREQYRRVLSGEGLSAAAAREDAWHRAVEFLFERLVVSWSVAGAEPLTSQKELLGRLRFASADERAWIRGVLREHLTEHFPELPAP
jgi:hypothetical protein